jgi:membrane-bound lytic murein transglycosylase MltF
MEIFEKWLNKELGKKRLKVSLVIFPTPSEDLLSGITEGRGDIAAGNLTITPERKKIVDFSDPFSSGAKEIIVAKKGASALKSLEDLSGKEITIRPSSSYYESLKKLNNQFKKSGRKPMKLLEADPYFEDEDILEMVNAGLISTTAVDEHLAEAWSKVFENLKVYPDLAVRTGGELAWAFRTNSPKLKKVINKFVAGHKQGTKLFNIVTNRYLKSTQWVKNALAKEDLQSLSKADAFFIKYADQYGFDWLFVAALAYQESKIEQSLLSPAGAIGVMQLLPATAKDPNVNIPNIEVLENNVHAGVKYLRFIRDRYFEKEPMDEANKTLFTMAGYNAGPAKIANLRKEAEKTEFDPNVWFRNVEVIAAKRIGRETVQYVSNIYKYYTAYRLIEDTLKMKKEVKGHKN